MKIAITAASSHIGKGATTQMIKQGFPAENIIAVARSIDKLEDLAHQGVQVRSGDYEDRVALTKALEGADRVLIVSSGAPSGERVRQHTNAIEASKAAGISFIAYTSMVNSPTNKVYALAEEHARTEELIAESGIPAAILRNGSYDIFYTEFLAGFYEKMGMVPDASEGGKISNASRAELAEATGNLLLQEKPEARAYELVGPDFVVADVATALSKKLGKNIKHRPVNREGFIAEFVKLGLEPVFAEFTAGQDAAIAAGELQHDSNDFEKLLGRKPMTIEQSFGV